MAWQNVYGSWQHTPGVKGDVIIGGGGSWNNFPGNPPGSPAPYGNGVSISTVAENTYRFNLSLVGYAISATAGQFFASYYAGTRADEYQWIIKAAISYETDKEKEQANYTHLFQENLKRMYYGGDPLYQYPNWSSYAYENTTTNTFTASKTDAWIRLEIYGKPAVEPLYAYFKLAAALQDYRPMAIRKSGAWKSLNTDSGFLNKRENGAWKAIPLISEADANQPNKGSSRIRKEGVWKAQSKIGN